MPDLGEPIVQPGEQQPVEIDGTLVMQQHEPPLHERIRRYSLIRQGAFLIAGQVTHLLGQLGDLASRLLGHARLTRQ